MIRIELPREKKILIASILISLVLVIFGILSGDPGVIGNVILLSIFIIVIPQLILNYINYRDLKEMEIRFPDFLRDLVEMTSVGLPLHKAIISVSKTDYGALTKEVKKMANQLSWNVNILTVLEHSKKRLRKIPALSKIMRVLIETYKNGGKIDKTLNSLSDTLYTIQETQKERKSMLGQYVVAMYVISLVFIGIIVAIDMLMVPIFESMSQQQASGMENPVVDMVASPCSTCLYTESLHCSPCKLYFGICGFLGSEKESISCYYIALFFSMGVIQSICGGLVAGQIGEGSVRAGIKHSLILFGITCGAFFILVKLGILGV